MSTALLFKDHPFFKYPEKPEGCGAPQLDPKVIQDAVTEICVAASVMQTNSHAVRCAALEGRTCDLKQWFATIRSLTAAVNMQIDSVEEKAG